MSRLSFLVLFGAISIAICTDYLESPNVLVCDQIKHFEIGGKYAKSLCSYKAVDNYTQAVTLCENAGMSLFVVGGFIPSHMFLAAVDAEFPDLKLARLWVDLYENEDEDESRKKTSQFLWQTVDTQFDAGKCPAVFKENNSDKFTFGGYDCSGYSWLYCEFLDELQEHENEPVVGIPEIPDPIYGMRYAKNMPRFSTSYLARTKKVMQEKREEE